MNLFKKPTKYKIEPDTYPNTYVVRKRDGLGYYSYVQSFKADTKEDIEKHVAFFSQPTLYI